ncbi:MAG: hypothetical protein ACLS4Z_08350 [Christensenellaceae bacterium]
MEKDSQKAADGISGKLGEKTELLGFFRKRTRCSAVWGSCTFTPTCVTTRISTFQIHVYTAMMGTLVQNDGGYGVCGAELTALSEEN